MTAPNGQQVTLTVPEGVVAGQQLQVEVPAKQVDEENLPANANAVYARAAPAASPKNAVRLVGASSLDRVGGGGGAAEGVGEEPGLLQAAELQAEAMALRTKLAEAEARLVAAAKEVEEAGIPALAAFSINIEVPEGGIPDAPVAEEAGVLPQQLAASQEEVLELQGKLRTAKEEAASQLRDAKRVAAQQVLEAERAVAALRTERLQLKEQMLAAEESALEAQEEMEAVQGRADEANEALAQVRLEAEMQAQLKEERKAALESEEQPLSPEGGERRQAMEGGGAPAEVQARLEQLEALAAERLAELEAAEEEKYTLSSDLEVLQEELEDANAHQKRYYEALMSKEQQLREMRSSCAALQTAVERLKHQSELQEARNNPVEEQLGGDDAYSEIDSLQAAAKAKDRELSQLQRELERVTSQVDDDDSLDQLGAGVRARYGGYGAGGEGEDEGEGDIGGEATYAQQQQMGREREETKRNDGNDALRSERERAAQVQQAQQAKLQLVQTKLQQAEARATEAAGRAHQLETKAKQQEREMLKLIAAKDVLAGGAAAGDDAVGELEDNLYEANAKLEEEQERATGLEEEKVGLTAQLQEARQEAQHKASALREVQQELEDEREARLRADRQLAQALGHG